MGLRNNLAGTISALRGNDRDRYRLAERVSQKIHPEAILSDRERLWLKDEDFQAIYRRFRGPIFSRTMDRVYFMGQLAEQAAAADGDTVECGAYDGLSSLMMCRATQPGRVHHVFDSFEGVSDPGEYDGDYWNRGDLAASEELLRSNLAGFDVETYEGWIPDRFDEVAHQQFCLVHIDVDLYQPTLDSLAFFYPRTVDRGVIVLDDYGFANCPGATKAVDEYMADKPETVVMAPTGQGIIFRRA